LIVDDLKPKMLPATVATANGAIGPAPASFTFDESKLLNAAETPEKKQLLLFQWLASLEKDVSKATQVGLDCRFKSF
jgi:hypothetical protein